MDDRSRPGIARGSMSESNAFRQFVTSHDADPIRKRVSPDWTAVPSGLIQAEGPFEFFNEAETPIFA